MGGLALVSDETCTSHGQGPPPQPRVALGFVYRSLHSTCTTGGVIHEAKNVHKKAPVGTAPALCLAHWVAAKMLRKESKTRHKPQREKVSVPLSASRGKLILRKGVKQDISLGERKLVYL